VIIVYLIAYLSKLDLLNMNNDDVAHYGYVNALECETTGSQSY